MLTVMSIAGFDPSGGAGALADIKTFAAMGCFGTAAVTSLTFQNTVAVYGASHQTPEVLRAQIEPVIDDFEIAAVKIGMAPTSELIEVIAEIIEAKRLPNVVVDTVIRSTSGYDLIDDAAVESLIERLLPLADVITPNMAEAERLTGFEVKDLDGMKRAARRIHEMSASPKSTGAARHAALVKGGHLEDDATDILFDGREFHIFQAPKIATRDTHGTGCALSSAIAALLARGCEVPEAVARAKQYLSEILAEMLRAAPDIGHGARPLNHFANRGMP